jgi:hypothetical protein
MWTNFKKFVMFNPRHEIMGSSSKSYILIR